MVEQARRHGPFDARYPARQKIAASAWELQADQDGAESLDSSGFLARFFPDRRRHDFEALAAFQAYEGVLVERAGLPTTRLGVAKRREAKRAASTSRSHLARILATSGAGAAADAAVALPALMDWESEGGSVRSD
jgi:hypothetical protein